jgi:cob(I)alamin adenosyltransferase
VTASLGKVKQSFGSAVGKALKGIGSFAAAAGAQLALLATRAFALVKAFAEDELATTLLGATLRKVGADVDAMLPKLNAFASAMQQQTTVQDDQVKGLASLGMNLGIAAEDIEGATVSAIGLSRALGIDATSAMRLIGKAANGSTEMLARYGVKLDDTLTPQQKFEELLKRGAAGFALEREAAASTSGELTQMGNVMGDAAEALGQGIAQSAGFSEAIKGVKDWVLNLINSGQLAEWARNTMDGIAELGKALNWLATPIKFVIESLTKLISGTSAMLAAFMEGGGVEEIGAAWNAAIADIDKIGKAEGAASKQIEDASNRIKTAEQGKAKVYTEVKAKAEDKSKAELNAAKSAADAAEEAFKAQKKISDDLEKEAEKLENDLAGVGDELLDLGKDMAELGDEKQLKAFEDEADKAADAVERLQEAVNQTPQERKAAEKEARKEERRKEKIEADIQEAEGKQARGVKGKGIDRLLGFRDARQGLKDVKGNIKQAVEGKAKRGEADLLQRAKDAAQKQLDLRGLSRKARQQLKEESAKTNLLEQEAKAKEAERDRMQADIERNTKDIADKIDGVLAME